MGVILHFVLTVTLLYVICSYVFCFWALWLAPIAKEQDTPHSWRALLWAFSPFLLVFAVLLGSREQQD